MPARHDLNVLNALFQYSHNNQIKHKGHDPFTSLVLFWVVICPAD